MRIYRAVPENYAVFHQFFNERLLPVYRKHGARLVGRWETNDDRVIVIWEYDDHAAYDHVQEAVQDDPDFIAAHEYRKSLPQLYISYEDVLMTSTMPI